MIITQEVNRCEYCRRELPPSKGKFKRKFCAHGEPNSCYNERYRKKVEMKEVCFNCNDWIETRNVLGETYADFKAYCPTKKKETSDLYKCKRWSKYRRKEI